MRRLPFLLLLLAATATPALAQSPVGEWVVEGDKARVRIAPCAGSANDLCGAIAWSYRPAGAPAGPLLDANNRDPALRRRPNVGLPLLQGFKPAGEGSWTGGAIYDPESGKTYRSKFRLESPDALLVDGCVLFVCQTQTWRRYAGGG